MYSPFSFEILLSENEEIAGREIALTFVQERMDLSSLEKSVLSYNISTMFQCLKSHV